MHKSCFFEQCVDKTEIYRYISLHDDTKVITMSSNTANVNDFLASGELVPAEVNASLKREVGRSFRKPSGATMNDQGHINLYAVEPKMVAAAKPSEDQKFRLGVFFAIVTWVPIVIAYFVS